MKNRFSIILIFFSILFFSQSNTEKNDAIIKAKIAIKLMDEEKFEESINILKECQKLDSENFDYPYEIAYAHYLKKDYNASIKILEKLENYKNVNYQLYQLWGNAYDLLNKPQKAIEIYDLGIKKFPNKGALYLEKGVVLEYGKDFNKAIESYQKGISIEPEYSSNYYRISKLFLNSKNIVPGLIYGEIFLNLERTTKRSIEMSELLYKSYKNAITFESNTVQKVDFCELVIDLQKYENEKKLPFCMIFGKDFIVALTNINEFNLENLANVREQFLKSYFEKDYKQYPNFLFNYLKKIDDQNLFNAYNHYIFQMGATKEFEIWKNSHEDEFIKFVEWYTKKDNIINPTKTDYYQFEY